MSNKTTFSTTTIILAIIGLVIGGVGGYFISNNSLQPKIDDLEVDMEALNSEVVNLGSVVATLEQELSNSETEIETLEDDISDF
jgi:hypothetical protein